MRTRDARINRTLISILKYNKYECTLDQELADAAAYALHRRFMCTLPVAALFCA